MTHSSAVGAGVVDSDSDTVVKYVLLSVLEMLDSVVLVLLVLSLYISQTSWSRDGGTYLNESTSSNELAEALPANDS